MDEVHKLTRKASGTQGRRGTRGCGCVCWSDSRVSSLQRLVSCAAKTLALLCPRSVDSYKVKPTRPQPPPLQPPEAPRAAPSEGWNQPWPTGSRSAHLQIFLFSSVSGGTHVPPTPRRQDGHVPASVSGIRVKETCCFKKKLSEPGCLCPSPPGTGSAQKAAAGYQGACGSTSEGKALFQGADLSGMPVTQPTRPVLTPTLGFQGSPWPGP